MHLKPGTHIKSPYQIVSVLGHGGFGVTYLGFDVNLQLKVAIKEYLPRELVRRDASSGQVIPLSDQTRAAFQAGLERFLTEARLLAKFQQHPGIVSVLSFFPALGTGYMVMEYVEGETLKSYLQRRGCLSWPQTLEIFMHIMDALRAVHQAGLLHRDVAPDNIYLCSDGRIKLLDFGAAQQSRLHFPSSIWVLKPGFAPEEQYRDTQDQGPWSDVYSVAASMYFCLTGRVPQDALDRLQTDQLRPPSDYGVAIPKEAERILMQALAIDALQRPQSMESLQTQWINSKHTAATAKLSPIVQRIPPVSIYSASLPESERQSVSFHWRPWLAFIIVALLISVFLWWQSRFGSPSNMPVNKPQGYVEQVNPYSLQQDQDNAEEGEIGRLEQARRAAQELKQQQDAALQRFEERRRQEENATDRLPQQPDPRHIEHLRSLCAEWGATMDCQDIR